jgi:hypothetical protein
MTKDQRRGDAMTEHAPEDFEAPDGVEEDEVDEAPDAPPEGDTQDPEADQ